MRSIPLAWTSATSMFTCATTRTGLWTSGWRRGWRTSGPSPCLGSPSRAGRPARGTSLSRRVWRRYQWWSPSSWGSSVSSWSPTSPPSSWMSSTRPPTIFQDQWQCSDNLRFYYDLIISLIKHSSRLYQLIQKHLQIYHTKLHYIDFYGPLMSLSHMDIWYLVSNNPKICQKSLEMTSRKKGKIFRVASNCPIIWWINF